MSQSRMKNLLFALMALVSLITLSATAHAAGAVVHRSVQEFVDAQGTTLLFTPPVPDQLGWSTPYSQPYGRFAMFDYAGKAFRYLKSANKDIDLKTVIEGQITERPLADGRAEVLVILETKSALTWVSTFNPDGDISQFNSNPLLLGYRVMDLLDDPEKAPALGDSHLQVVFRNPKPGAPLPDLVCFNRGDCPEVELVSLSFRGTATGPLRAAAGLGPEGSSGRCFVVQTGVLLRGPWKGATTDGFPAEIVEIRRVSNENR